MPTAIGTAQEHAMTEHPQTALEQDQLLTSRQVTAIVRASVAIVGRKLK